MITFDVCLRNKSFELNTRKIEWVKDTKSALKEALNVNLEQFSDIGNLLSGNGNSFIRTVAESFAEHRHLVLDPDTVWQTIAMGLAQHINKNSEELRHHFVDFEGKKDIIIQRDEFVKGGTNDWESCFDEFSEKIGEFIGKKKDLIVSNFSTTDRLQKVSSEIILMEAMSKYFYYGMTTCCGIPSVTLEGTVEDWENIKERVSNFDEFGLSWWTQELNPVLDEIIKSAKGNPSFDFWNSFYNEGGGSGGPFITGHIVKFFPYIGRKLKKHSFQEKWLTIEKFPNSFSSVSFVWDYLGTKYPMKFIGGLMGTKQIENGGVRCSFGWALHESSITLDLCPMEFLNAGLKIYSQDGEETFIKDIKTYVDYKGNTRIETVTIPIMGKDYDFYGYDLYKFTIKEVEASSKVKELIFTK